MFDVTTFLMRWMFLSNILHNVAEIQTFPQRHPPPPPPPPPQHHHDPILQEDHWRNQCLQTILSYPPGSHRLLMTDAYRVELVQKLAHKLSQAHEALRLHRLSSSKASSNRRRIGLWGVGGGGVQSASMDDEDNDNRLREDAADLDADLEIVQALQSSLDDSAGAGPPELTGAGPPAPDAESSDEQRPSHPQTFDAQSTQHATGSGETSREVFQPKASDVTLDVARHRLTQTREYLPQLVSAVLKSPAPVDPALANPVQLLRQLLLNRCSQDPSWGIELCWLLEADVGRAWKALLEHPQQTGRRLLVIMPAEKAAVLASIGHEKRDSFNFLQDAEYATAYGNTANDDPAAMDDLVEAPVAAEQHDMLPSEPRLPSSISQRRCAHFGDTMHFVDRLTKLSLDLRRIPTPERREHLHNGLAEMNRRIRRRMVTKGEMSLDMEDNYGPNDWPRVEDLKTDMLQHSVHFPLVPQTGTWHTGEDGYVPYHDNQEVVRVLNIVVPESRLLASRERCPFLVQLEVADTGMEGGDARLYTSGASNVGSTIEEALSMNTLAVNLQQEQQQGLLEYPPDGETHAGYNIPHELLTTPPPPEPPAMSHLRGGSISSEYPDQHQEFDQHFDQNYPEQYPYHEQIAFQDENVAYGFPDPSGVTRQFEVEDLHQQLQYDQDAAHAQQLTFPEPYEPYDGPLQQGKAVLTGVDLLDEVFGVPWVQRCREIKEASPFGQVEGWRLASFIMKAGEDIRKESLVMQIISKLRSWFEEEIQPAYRPYMRPYTIMSVGGDAGLVECLADAKSVDELKKKTDSFESLRDFFERAFEPAATCADSSQTTFEQAQDNFLRSLVGYSLVCYILQIKDRHNANILMDREGHIMHIDFGFVLGDTPKMGKVPIFSERAPFKLSAEFWDVLGGWNTKAGGLGVQFCKMFEMAFACASNHAEEIATTVELTMLGLNHDARTARVMANGVRSRLRMRGAPGSDQQKMFIVELISTARASWGTTTYDWLQKNMNGYQ